MPRPPFDPSTFVIGVVCVVIAVLGLLDPGVTRRINLGVLWPATLIGIGLALLATARRSRKQSGRSTG
jgi:hypothetical protein